MKKRLDATAVTNELKGASLFFEKQNKNSSLALSRRERANERTDERVNARTSERTNARTRKQKAAKRKVVRHSYQFYEDQISALERLRAEMELKGKRKQLSEFVREAVDAYLRERTNARTDERANAKITGLTTRFSSA